MPLLTLGGCGFEQLLFGRAPVEPPPEPLPPTRSNGPQGDVTAGLAPLPTPQQVLAAVPFGRTDPFAPFPVQAPAAGAPGPNQAANAAGGGSASSGKASAAAPSLAPPPGFLLTGVVRSGGRAEALVTYGAASGSLRLGDRGGKNTALLPSGWTLASIQFGGGTPSDPPSVTLKSAGQKVRVRL